MTETSKNYIPDEILDEAQGDPRVAFGLMSLQGEWNEPKTMSIQNENPVELSANIISTIPNISGQAK